MQEWKKLIDSRVQQSASQDSMLVNGPMKALAVIAPDGRKRIYKNGQLAATVSMWEHGLAIVGLYNAYKNNLDFIILNTDKNLGPAILEKDVYKERCLKDHLLDTKTYKQLEPWEAYCKLKSATEDFQQLVQRQKKCLPESEQTYFQRGFEELRRMPQFYTAFPRCTRNQTGRLGQ